MSNNPYANRAQQNNGQPQKKGGGCIGVIVFIIIIGASAFSEIGEDALYVFIPLLIAVGVVGAIIFAVTKAVKSTQNAQGTQYPQNAYRPVQNQRPMSNAYPVNPARNADAHLCDPGAHKGTTFKETRYFDAIQEMEPGYKQDTSVPPLIKSRFNARIRRLTPEQLRRKREELHDLLNAGIITPSEFRDKMDEYDD